MTSVLKGYLLVSDHQGLVSKVDLTTIDLQEIKTKDTFIICQQPKAPGGLPGSQCGVAAVPSMDVSSLSSYCSEAAVHRMDQFPAHSPENVRSDNGDVAARIHSDLTWSTLDGPRNG